jgi:dienelactone hydrolase
VSIRWFGGPGQPPGICEIPLETFVEAVDLLQAKGMRRIGALGLSKGAEAVLLLGIRDPRVDAVVAMSPTSVVWANVGPGADGVTFPYRSSWTWRGRPLPFVPYADRTAIEAARTPTAYRANYERSREMYAEAARQAVIPIEEATAEVVLVAGGDDQMWPSMTFAQELAARRTAAGQDVRLIGHREAGHRPRLPGEGPAGPSDRYDYGGTAEADAALGTLAWPEILGVLTKTRP